MAFVYLRAVEFDCTIRQRQNSAPREGLRYLSDNYETAAKKGLGKDYPDLPKDVLLKTGAATPLQVWYEENEADVPTVIGLPANLFYSTGIPVCILVLKKCKKPDDVLFINAAEHFVKGKRQNQLSGENIAKIIATYQNRTEAPRYSRRVEMAEIEKNDFNLNISRYISTALSQDEIVLADVHRELMEADAKVREAIGRHNAFLEELKLPLLP